MQKLLFSFLFLLPLCFGASAQIIMPAPSPAASVMQQVGFTKIEINYSSPGVKGRTVFGDLEPWGRTWRAGANAATTVSFSTPVNIGGKTLRAGEYTMFVTPMQKGMWQVHFNKDGKSVFNYMANGAIDEDALRADNAAMVEVEPKKSAFMERLTYTVSANDNKTAQISLHWADTRIDIPVDVRTEAMADAIMKMVK